MDITNRLDGKVALVTGGSRGIGAEIVRRLAAEGADIGFTYNTGQDEAQQVAAQVRDLGRRALAVQADLAGPAAATAVMDAAVAAFGTDFDRSPVVHFCGDDPHGQEDAAECAARAMGRQLFTMARLRSRTTGMSIEIGPVRTPNSAPRPARYATSALATIVFVGVQP